MKGIMSLKGHTRRVVLAGIDVLCYAILCAIYLGIDFLFLEDTINKQEVGVYFINALILLVITSAFRIIFRAYTNIWRYTNTSAYLNLVVSDIVGGIVAWLIIYFSIDSTATSQILALASLNLITALSARFTYRIWYKNNHNSDSNNIHKIPVAIVGAGQIGALLANELINNKNSRYRPLFFIDRDTTKMGSYVSGLKVYPENEKTIEFIKTQTVSEIFIALTSLDSESLSYLHQFYSKTGCRLKIYETPVKEIEGNEDITPRRTIRDFQIEDLLFRNRVDVVNRKTLEFYSGKTVLITGGGGSIGSEICRQIAKCHPKKLVIVDIYENNAYEIQQELIRKYGNRLDLAVEIGSVRDRVRLDCIFEAYKPNIVFHAAAHKHVPLMEHSGCEAIKNNVRGTYNTADMAEKHGVEKFILISTDKAVNPTNIMGASKRLCEMVVQCRTDSKTSFAAVRFGNVLGSNGSVIPLFRNQIANGGPVTITDKRITRFFMTIPEASQLVMQAGAMAKNGELFVLDMGKSVKIYDLAVNMIKLSGLEPGVDIKIREIGLRPGEKLYEELLMKTETLTKTDNNKIFVETDTPYSREEVEEKLAILDKAVEQFNEESVDSTAVKEAIRQVVPTFHDPEELNKDVK
ncbi:MAG: polysaccharide biosynthesis protein [Clostridia bacterium]|nr:polysaccharide biosynthesis protein [Clostridia bacterium]